MQLYQVFERYLIRIYTVIVVQEEEQDHTPFSSPFRSEQMSDNAVGNTTAAPGSPTEADAARREDLMKQQNAIAKNKFGGLQKKGPLSGKSRSYFDSADHFSGKQTGKAQAVDARVAALERVSEGANKKQP